MWVTTSFEAQQKNLNAELKKGLDETKTELAILKNQIAELKNQKCAVENELTRKFEGQQRGLAESKELQHILIKYGNNPDGMSALHYAIKLGDANAVNLLIANGADVNTKDGNFTTLTRAASCNQYEITQILLSLGANVNLTASEHVYCAINYAAEFGSGELVTLLAEHGAILDRIYPKDLSNYAKTPLYTATKTGNYEAVIALVSAGASIDANIPHNICGHQTPLDIAAENLEYAVNPQNLELVKFLVDNGATRRYLNYLENPRTNNVKCPVISGYLRSVNK